MSTKAIPSFGALTPVESMMKGGKASDLFNPSNIMNDTMLAINKPSSLLINPMKDEGKTATAKATEQEDAATAAATRNTNKWLNWSQNRGNGLTV